MKKRLLSILLTVCMVLSLLPTMALGASTAWDGSADTSWYEEGKTAFTLTTAEQLAGLAQLVNGGEDFYDKTVSLGDDIVLNASLSEDSRQWTPIGDATAGKGFAGTFDGCGHTVSGLYINNNANNQALFGYISAREGSTGGTVRNLGVVDSAVTCASQSGGVVGYSNAGLVANCYADVTVHTGGNYAGGIAGSANSTITVENCYNVGTVTAGGSYAGGIAPYPTIGPVLQCYGLGSAVPGAGGDSGSLSNSRGYLIGWTMSATVTGNHFSGADGTLSGGGTLVEKLNSWVDAQESSDYYTWHIADGANGGYPVQDAPLSVGTYAVTVTAKLDGAAWDDSGKTFTLKNNATTRVNTNLNAVKPGEYSVLDGGADTGVTVTVTGADTSVEVNYYTVSGTVSDYAGGSNSVVGLMVKLYAADDIDFATPLATATTGEGGSYSLVWSQGGYVARVAGEQGVFGAGQTNVNIGSAVVTGANITLSKIVTQSIAITSTNHKTAYRVSDALDVSNLKIAVTMSDGATKDVAVTADMVSVFNSSITTDSLSLTITYDDKTTNYTISIGKSAYTGTQASVPTAASKTENNITLAAQSISGETVEYAKSDTAAVPTTGWQTSIEFSGLSGGTYYYFFARVKESATHGVGTTANARIRTNQGAFPETLDIADGSITVDDGTTSGTIKVTQGSKTYDDLPVTTQIGISGTSANTITANTSCNIFFSDVTITAADNTWQNPMNITVGTVTLTLADGTENTLQAQNTSSNYNGIAALRVNTNAALIINGSTGKLIANGGNGYVQSGRAPLGGSGAGIGADSICFNSATVAAPNSSGSVIINGGIITATGGSGSSWGGGGAGIGGGGGSLNDRGYRGGASGTVTINGGFVTATGGYSERRGGAGIGGGGGGAVNTYSGVNSSGSSGQVTITGGTVISTGGTNNSGIGTEVDSGSILTVTGGSIKATISGAAPTNGKAAVYKTTFTAPGASDGTQVAGLVISGHSTNDVYTVDTNKAYFYLPAGGASATYGDKTYKTTVKTDGSAVFTVDPQSFTATASMSGYTYSGTVSTPSVSANPGSGAVTYYYNTDGKNSGGTEWKDISATTLNAGDYYMYAVIAAADDFTACTTAAVKFTVAKTDQSTPAAPTVSGMPTSGSITVTSVSGQMYFCQLAGSTAPTSAVPGWTQAAGTTMTFSSLSPSQSYDIFTYIPEDTNHNISGVSAKLNTTTASAKVTSVTAPGDVMLTKYYTTGAAVIPGLPGAAKATLEGGGTQYLNITWTAPDTYNAAPSAANTYTWSVSAPTNYTFDTGVVSSGSITITNKAATPVAITATKDEKILTRSYAGSTFTVTDLFSIDSHAGTPTYSVTEGTGRGTITAAGVLTVTTAGTFTVQVDTAATGNYASGSATATLTVNKGTGSGTVTIADWVYGGTAKTVTATVSNKVGEDTFVLAYSNNSKTNAGSYTTEVTALGNGNYTLTGAVNASKAWVIDKAPISFTLSDNSYTYDNTAHTANVAQTASQTPAIATGKYTVTYKLPAEGSGTADKTNGGVYDVIVTLSDDNFCFVGESDAATRSHKVGTMTIKQNTVTALWKNTTTVYDGNEKSPILELVGLKSGDTDVKAQLKETKTNVGNYTVTAELSGANSGNYTLTNPVEAFIIQRAPVSFTLTGNSVKKGESVNVNATPSVNGISATLTYWQSGKQVGAPTETGSYDVYAEITNPNYRHAGGTDGTAQKIGVLTIYEGNTPATYTISFDANDATGNTASMDAVQAGTVHILPESGFTSTGKTFSGWQYGSKIYQPGECFTQPSSNVTLKALWNDKVYSIGGTVQEGNPESNAANVVVTLMLGSRQIGQTVTGANGTYSFANVVPGVYNLVANKAGVTQTVMVTIEDKAVTNQTISMPAGKLNSVVEVKAGSPAIVVGDLEKAFTEQDKTNAASKTVELKLTAEAKAADRANNAQQEIEKKAGGVDLFLDFTLTKTVDGTRSTLNGSPVLLTAVITLPAELQGRDSYTVYRYHGVQVQTLTTTANTDDEKIEVSKDKTTLTVYTKNFSAYAIKGVTYSGGSGGVSSYKLTFEVNGGSAITALSTTSGATVDLSAYTPTREGYTFAGWYSDAKLTKAITSVKLTANATVYAKWTEKEAMPFTDVPADAYYNDAVLWALDKGVTSGTTAATFNPDGICTRAQAVTFLWRAMGGPEPTSVNCPFTDVKTGEYYYKAVLWATEKSITKGTSDITFSPNMIVTRGQTMTFLWRTAGNPAAGVTNPFADVKTDAYYADAVLWGVKEGITSGTSSSTFTPAEGCSRAQIVTFLYRYLAK